MSNLRPEYAKQIETPFGPARAALDENGNISIGPYVDSTKSLFGIGTEQTNLAWALHDGKRYQVDGHFKIGDNDIVAPVKFGGGTIHKTVVWTDDKQPTRVSDTAIIATIIAGLRDAAQAFVDSEPNRTDLVTAQTIDIERNEARRDGFDKRIIFENTIRELVSLDRRLETLRHEDPVYISRDELVKKISEGVANPENDKHLSVLAYLVLHMSVEPSEDGKKFATSPATNIKESDMIAAMLS